MSKDRVLFGDQAAQRSVNMLAVMKSKAPSNERLKPNPSGASWMQRPVRVGGLSAFEKMSQSKNGHRIVSSKRYRKNPSFAGLETPIGVITSDSVMKMVKNMESAAEIK